MNVHLNVILSPNEVSILMDSLLDWQKLQVQEIKQDEFADPNSFKDLDELTEKIYNTLASASGNMSYKEFINTYINSIHAS